MGIFIGFAMGALVTWICMKMIAWSNELDKKNEIAEGKDEEKPSKLDKS